jgi:hypothetical protein
MLGHEISYWQWSRSRPMALNPMTTMSSCIDRKRWKGSILGHEICKCEGSRSRSLAWGSTKGVRVISSWTNHVRSRREWKANRRRGSLGKV